VLLPSRRSRRRLYPCSSEERGARAQLGAPAGLPSPLEAGEEFSINPNGAGSITNPYLRLSNALLGIGRCVDRVKDGLLPVEITPIELIVETDDPTRIPVAPAHLEFQWHR
jgi:hypothetical protein